MLNFRIFTAAFCFVYTTDISNVPDYIHFAFLFLCSLSVSPHTHTHTFPLKEEQFQFVHTSTLHNSIISHIIHRIAAEYYKFTNRTSTSKLRQTRNDTNRAAAAALPLILF